MTEGSPGPVVVAVDHPDRAAQLVRTARDLAALADRGVCVVTVAVKPATSPFGVFEDSLLIDQYAADSQAILDRVTDLAPPGVPLETEVVVATSVAEGITNVVQDRDPLAVVVGWEDRRRRDALLGTTVDRLLKRLPCDLFVERIGTTADGVESVLLPVAGGPHLAPATSVAKAIALRNDASVSLVSVAAGDVSSDAARGFLEEARGVLESVAGPDIPIEEHHVTGDAVAEAIIREATAHDIVVFGATRQGALRRRIVGSIPRAVAEGTDRTVVLGRAGAAVPDRYRRLGRVLPSFG